MSPRRSLGESQTTAMLPGFDNTEIYLLAFIVLLCRNWSNDLAVDRRNERWKPKSCCGLLNGPRKLVCADFWLTEATLPRKLGPTTWISLFFLAPTRTCPAMKKSSGRSCIS